ncbi:signal peptidase complex subunit 1 [Lingula anatina]|uniref:Signal peptidase complex subunit 1 n=1 Tax=Lingula anatina TaxID=7574 RepID=A0A1S3IXF4_LINAN|nr:signal peptidase complex subunit 1 [Lingula anatina]|eukprot:XP_013402880.2 signal peptidase complex subunit 1 [Lingula anatina]
MDFVIGMLPESVRNLPTHMDFDGQRRAERIFQIIIVLFAAVGFVWGYICQQFSQTMYILGAGFVLSCLLTLPPWPIYRRKPLPWQKARPSVDEKEGSTSQAAAAPAGKGKKKK